MKACRQLCHFVSFDASISLGGTAVEVDEAMLDLLAVIAASAESFPIVQVPDLRVATMEGCPFAVFFRIRSPDQVNLLWSLRIQTSILRAA